jgi:hypothetical protein
MDRGRVLLVNLYGGGHIMDRIELTYKAIDEMISFHGKERPNLMGGGVWNAKEEFLIYKEQVGDRYTDLQWQIITSYFLRKFHEVINED